MDSVRPKPVHPSTLPIFEVHLNVGDVLLFRGDMFHAGHTYLAHHYRLFEYWQALLLPLRVGLPKKNGFAFEAQCECDANQNYSGMSKKLRKPWDAAIIPTSLLCAHTSTARFRLALLRCEPASYHYRILMTTGYSPRIATMIMSPGLCGLVPFLGQ